MHRITGTARRLGTPFLLIAAIGLTLVGGLVFVGERARASDECRINEGDEPAVVPEDDELQPVRGEDRLILRFGMAGGKRTALAGIELPSSLDLDGRSLEVRPALFTHTSDQARRIAPEVFKGTATVSDNSVLVRLCADSADINPGTYEGEVVVGGFAVIDAQVLQTSWLILLGLPLAIGPALVAVAAVDDKEHTRYLFLVALLGAILAWFTFRSTESLTTAGDIATMLGVQFAGGSGFLLGLKTLWSTPEEGKT